MWSKFRQSGDGKVPVALISVLSKAACNVPGLFFSGLEAKGGCGDMSQQMLILFLPQLSFSESLLFFLAPM